jgi:hypothetical protein
MSNYDTVVVVKKLVVPIGTNLISETLRTRAPSPGALAYDSTANLLYYGNATDWIQAQGPTGPQGPQGPQGIAGPTGPAGPQGPLPTTNDYGNVTWSLVNSDGEVTIASAGVIPWNHNTVAGGVGYTGTQLVVNTPGTYVVNFGYGLFLPSATNNMPQSFSLITNGNTATAASQYTLQEREDPGPNPQSYFDASGQSATTVMTFAAGDTLNMINSLNGSTVCNFMNNIDGTYTINGGVGAIAAYITIYRLA